ncbi:ABC transporter ATP-binding protein [Candidatus Stoquefichus massiliensis]|uniref:ABC transporter ATP-binding protein n=1 Tax=Candidatus Stoquefichus massiliensis TaxID=1470350 RepID=UPI0004841382|nr:ABC transporter ATP-binding protein [Candidatus Stoquefichus massiliensis]
MEKVVKMSHVSKTYGEGAAKVHALRDVSIEIEKGTFVTVIGKSGSGKSTLLHVMGGLEKPDTGEVNIQDISLYQLKDDALSILRRRQIGFVFQFFNLIPSQNVYENIILPMRLDGRKEDQQYVDDIIHVLGLDDKKYAYIDELSGGQQQRVAIARALASKPSIILLDEPTGNLDSQNSHEVVDLLRLSQRKYNQTIVMVTHDAMMANKADRIITIEDGQIVGDENV